MRLTLHAVHADDHRTFREAMHPVVRASRLGPRFTASGLTAEDADALVPRLLEFADRPRTTAECEAWLSERLGQTPEPGAWWGLRQYTPLLHAPTAPPWSFGNRPSYIAPLNGPPRTEPAASAASLRELVVRYLEGFGPASVMDVAQFAMVRRTDARAALADLAGRLERLTGPAGEELFDLPGSPARTRRRPHSPG